MTSADFRQFLKRYNIKHTYSSPYHPATNGAAENFVKTVKSKVDKIIRDGNTLDFSLNRFLSDYRNTANITTNKTPSQLMFKRELRTRFDLLKPDTTGTVEKHQFDQQRFKHGNRKCDFATNETVYAKNYRKGSNDNAKAVIVEKLSPAIYNVKFSDGFVTKRHINQIVKTNLDSILRRGEEAPGDESQRETRANSERKNRVGGNSEKSAKEKNKNHPDKKETPQAPRRSARIANKHQP